MTEALPRDIVSSRLLVQNEANELLLVKRSLQSRHNPGQWEAPGGKLDGMIDIKEALQLKVGEKLLEGTGLYVPVVEAGRREAEEETGFQVEATSDPVLTEIREIKGGSNHGKMYVLFSATGTITGGEAAVSGVEETKLAWANLLPLRYNCTDQTRETIEIFKRLNLLRF